MAAQATSTSGSQVWVEDPEVAWIDGEVIKVHGDTITVKCSNEKTVTAKASHVHAKDPEESPCGVDDMTKLAYLHEPGVLQNLKSRYHMNEIYTYIGNILIAVNPFQRLPHLYDTQMMEQYKGAAFGELSPHPFAVADVAYRLMLNEGASQSIIVSGESGAGKTEITKMIMHYLAYIGGKAAFEGRTVEKQVLQSNPVLEAFGNAKTVRNNNSSFGKIVEIQFDQRGRISGAAVRTYLLERSRVCQISDPDRNYHCFYMLCAAPHEELKRYKLGDPSTFHYLNQSNCYKLNGLDESKEYLETRKAMDIIGISSEEQEAIFRVVAAILHLGNVEFAEGDDGDSSRPNDEKSLFHLRTAAELFMCDEKALEDSLCKRVIVTRDIIVKTLDPEAAKGSRDALAKIVYSRLFDWLVNKVNSSIDQDPNSKCLIGVLDIYGFESFKTNSFEQFCINLTNEKLQQHFNQHVFKMEQEEYTKEEINWNYVEFIDNQDVLYLIEKKPGGIISLLDEACMLPRSTHETFAQKLYQTFKNNKRFTKPKLSPSDFTICHYAGDVTYQTELFLDKNKDYAVAEHEALLSASKCSFVSGLFPLLSEYSSKSSKFSSIGSRFKQQLQALSETLSATEPHYICCVDPNNLLRPTIFENQNVLQQLRCGGVMEAIRISCAEYPTRRTFYEFIDRFGILAPDVLSGSSDEATAVKRLLEKVDLQGHQIGKTKVFLRAGQMAELDAHRNEVLGRSASMIQRKVRSFLARKSFIAERRSALQLQTTCRVSTTPSFSTVASSSNGVPLDVSRMVTSAHVDGTGVSCGVSSSGGGGGIGVAGESSGQFNEKEREVRMSQIEIYTYMNDVCAVDKLVEEDGELVNVRDCDGHTPLHFAACNGSLNVAIYLLAKGADINARNCWNNTPLDVAESVKYGDGANRYSIIEFLKKNGGITLVPTKSPSLRANKASWEIDPIELDIDKAEVIGQGSFGQVLKTSWRGKVVAVKCLYPNETDELLMQDFRDEISLLMDLKHKNVVEFIGAVTESTPLMLVTEFLEGGDLYYYLEKKGPLAPLAAIDFALDIARGMEYLHNGDYVVIHRDLKPRNILLTSSTADQLKVADFGLSKAIKHGVGDDEYIMTGSVGTDGYIAPEVYENKQYGKEVDIFSFAMILYQMLKGEKPFFEYDDMDVAKRVVKGERPDFKGIECPFELKELIKSCWAGNIVIRPSFPEIIKRLESIKEKVTWSPKKIKSA